MNSAEMFSGPIVENDVLETMATASASRYFKPDPLPDEVLRSILFAATRASSPANLQPWDFVVVRDPVQIARIADALEANADRMDEINGTTGVEHGRMLTAVAHLLRSLRDVPAIVFVCGRLVYPKHAPLMEMTLSACFAASQNLIVAARALGVGAAFTVLHAANEERDDSAVRQILDLPPEVHIVTTIPLGWPEKKFVKVRRKALDEVVHLDRYQNKTSSA